MLTSALDQELRSGRGLCIAHPRPSRGATGCRRPTISVQPYPCIVTTFSDWTLTDTTLSLLDRAPRVNTFPPAESGHGVCADNVFRVYWLLNRPPSRGDRR